jgi:colicin import membrane protein
MKDFKSSPKQNATAIGFTIGVHIVAVVGLLYLGMSKPPEPPKPIKTVLVKPEDLKIEPPEESDFIDTAHPNIAEKITQTAEPVVDAPVIPTPAPDKPNIDTQKAAQQAQLAKEKAQAAEAARLKAQAEANAKKDAQSKAKAEEELKQKTKEAQKAKAAADAKAKAANDAKIKAANDAKIKAANDAKIKAANDVKIKAANDAKIKAANDAKAKADAEAKAKADAEAKASSAEKARQEAAKKKAEARTTANTAKKDFESRIRSRWNVPSGNTGKSVRVRIMLTPSGGVSSINIISSSGDDSLDDSIKQAIRNSAPFPMPSDPQARSLAQEVISTFTAR